MEATQNTDKTKDKEQRLPLALQIALRNSPKEQFLTLQKAFHLQQNGLDRTSEVSTNLTVLLASSSLSEDDNTSEKNDQTFPKIEHEDDSTQGDKEIPSKLKAEGRVKNLKLFWLRTSEKTDNFPPKNSPGKLFASTLIKRSDSVLCSGFSNSKANNTNLKSAPVEDKRKLRQSWSLTTESSLPSITSFSKTQPNLGGGSSSENESSLSSVSSSSVLSLVSTTDDESEQDSSNSEVSCIPEETKSLNFDSSSGDEVNYSIKGDSSQDSETSVEGVMVKYKYFLDHDQDSYGKPIVWFRTDSDTENEKTTSEDIGYTSYESCNSSNSSLPGRRPQGAKEPEKTLGKNENILTYNHKKTSAAEGDRAGDVSSRSVREKIACFNSGGISEKINLPSSVSDILYSSASTDEEMSQRKTFTCRESETPQSVFTDSDSDRSSYSSDYNVVVVKYKYYLSSNKDSKGRTITWTKEIHEEPQINVNKFETNSVDVLKNERTSEKTEKEKTDNLRHLSSDKDNQETEVENVAFAPIRHHFHRHGKGIFKNVEETLAVYKTSKLKKYRKKNLPDVLESGEKAIFKTTIHGLRYNAVLKLSDDVSYLRTFIHVISGIPPKKQYYLHIARKKHPVRTVQDLGVNAGDILQLEVI